MLNNQLRKRIQSLFSNLREIDGLVIDEIGTEYTEQDVRDLNNSYNEYYIAVQDIRNRLGKILDDIDSGRYDTEEE